MPSTKTDTFPSPIHTIDGSPDPHRTSGEILQPPLSRPTAPIAPPARSSGHLSPDHPPPSHLRRDPPATSLQTIRPHRTSGEILRLSGEPQSSGAPSSTGIAESQNKMDLYLGSSPKKLIECRICHDEDQESSMETPCACRGSLKYAHRMCVQRWCNEKGNTICEICLQPFKPGYTSRPQLFCFGGFPMNFRENWEISRRPLYNMQFSDMVATNHDYLESDFDEYIDPNSRSLLCCRIVAIVFVILLVLRLSLPIIINGTRTYSITMFMLHLLRFIGILLPICIMARSYTSAQCHRQQTDHRDLMPDEENDLPQTESQPRFIHVN